MDNRRLRKLLREQEAQEAAAAEARQRKREREEEERRRLETAAAEANETISALTARLGVAEQMTTKHRREAERAGRLLEESDEVRGGLERKKRALEGSLEKIGAFLRSRGIAVTSDDATTGSESLASVDDTWFRHYPVLTEVRSALGSSMNTRS